MITLKADGLVIDSWEINDEDLVNFFSAVKANNDEALEREREELLLRAIKIGVTALQQAETGVDTDAGKRQFDDWQRECY